MSFASQYASVIKSDEGDALHSADVRYILLRHGEEFDPEGVQELESRSTVIPGEWLDIIVVISGSTQENLGLTPEEYLSFFTNLKVEARLLDKPPESTLGRRPLNQQFVVVNRFQHTTGPKAFPTSIPVKSMDEYNPLPAAKSPTRSHLSLNEPSDQVIPITSLPEDFYDSQDAVPMKSIINSQNDIIYQYRIAVGLPVPGYSRFLDISMTPQNPLQSGGPMSESRRRCLGTLATQGYAFPTLDADLLNGSMETVSWTNKKHNIELRLDTLNPLNIICVQSSKAHPFHFSFVLENQHPTENLVVLSATMDIDKHSGPDELLASLQNTPLQIISRNHEIPFHLSPSEQHSVLFSVDAQKLGEKPVNLTGRLSCILNIRWKLPKMSHVVFSQHMVSWNYDSTSDLQTIWEGRSFVKLFFFIMSLIITNFQHLHFSPRPSDALTSNSNYGLLVGDIAPNFVAVDNEFTAKVTVSNLSLSKRYDLLLQTTLPHVSG
eukprot:TRINITY_DN1563_c0_g3_i2.p1 TRINITY_DN1563_c0_g3~~TRINITY_DN1563_c0_g3_i2.p1  ORF type:complete len:492 (-),score=58.40 TRINITY_DN1563_c0_g3_i2:1058-2533(-)